MTDRPKVTRTQALAYRAAAQGLDRGTVDAAELAIWELGVQNTPDGSAALSLAARLEGGFEAVPDLSDARSHVSVWGTRGAPMIVHPGEARRFAAALWPLDDADAVTRLAGNGQQLRKAGVDPIEAISVTAEAMRKVVTATMTKGEVSTEVTSRLPEEYITWCRGCQAHHLGDQLMRMSGLPAGLRLELGESPATLTPMPRWKGVPKEPAGTDEFVLSYLHLHGPATPAEVASFLGTSQRPVKDVWPDGLVEVDLAGRTTWLPEADIESLLRAKKATGVRLLPRSDPWMLSRDRDLIVPKKANHKTLWPMLGHPGAVYVDGEIVGAWRTKATTKRLTVNVTPFATIPPKARTQVEHEAAHVAAQRGLGDVQVVYL